MTKKNTKRALLLSGLALLMCFSMLIGSTYAWFTDSVTSGNNIIKSGTLKVAMEWADAKSFADVLWENLNADNKVSLFVRTIDIANGETDTVIINRHN